MSDLVPRRAPFRAAALKGRAPTAISFKTASACRTVPERVSQAEIVFPWVNAHRQRGAQVGPSSVRWSRRILLAYRRLIIGIRLGCRRFASGSCHRSFHKRDCSQHIPSRGAARGYRERLCRPVGPADADLSGANSSPHGPLHPERRAVWPGPLLAQADASTVRLELAQAGGISGRPEAVRSNDRPESSFFRSPLSCFPVTPRRLR